MIISLPLLSQLFLKYAYTVNVLIHQFTHMEFANSTLPILLSFWKTIWLQKTWMNLNQVHWQNCFAISKFHVGKLMNQNVHRLGIFQKQLKK